MKIFVVLSLMMLTASAAVLPNNPRLRRDVSELMSDSSPPYQYLPPSEKLEEEQPATTETLLKMQPLEDESEVTTVEPASAALGENGYEYRTVRRLKYRHRNRRDVSHLSTHYLPPSQEYLPPVPQQDDTEEVISAKISQEYLPPAVKSQEEAATTEAAIEETTTPTAALIREAISNAGPLEAQQDTAILSDDGYHYKEPVEIPDLKAIMENVEYLPPAQEEPVDLKAIMENVQYLPPAAMEEEPKMELKTAVEYLPSHLEKMAENPEEIMVVEGPADNESAILADDGYHYRAVKRLRF